MEKDCWWNSARDKTEWDRSLGTSKEEQGVETPPQPRPHKDSCRCLYRGGFLYELCYSHSLGYALAKKSQTSMMEEWEKKQVTEEKPEEPVAKPNVPFVDFVDTADNVKVEIVEPTNETPTATS
jgi:hypothetical protein